MTKIIIYYSQGGTTDLVARTLAKKLGAYLLRIQDLKNREGFANRLLSSISAFRESKTEIAPASVDLTPYDTIYFGTPTWSGNPTPAILTMIDRCNLRGKDVVLFATMDSNRGNANIERLEEEIEGLEIRIAGLEKEMLSEELALDFEKLSVIGTEITALRSELEGKYEEWEKAQEQDSRER